MMATITCEIDQTITNKNISIGLALSLSGYALGVDYLPNNAEGKNNLAGSGATRCSIATSLLIGIAYQNFYTRRL